MTGAAVDVGVLLDEQLSVDVDLDKAVPCEAVDGCAGSATWVATHTCPARHSTPLCEPCKEVSALWIDECIARSTFMFCSLCNEDLPLPIVQWRHL